MQSQLPVDALNLPGDGQGVEEAEVAGAVVLVEAVVVFLVGVVLLAESAVLLEVGLVVLVGAVVLGVLVLS
jgi:hypothetical protein